MKSKYSNKEIEFNERRMALEKADEKILSQITEIGKLLKKPSLAYRMASDEKKHDLVKSLMENFSWNGDSPMPVWKKEFEIVANRPKNSIGSP